MATTLPDPPDVRTSCPTGLQRLCAILTTTSIEGVRPHYLGHSWSAASLWIGAAVYLVASALLGYLGWRASPVE